MIDHKIKLSFLLTGFDGSPDEITSYLGIQPTTTWMKGELIPRTIIKRKENGWQLYPGEIQNVGFEKQLNDLVRMITPISEKVSILCNKYKGRLFCALFLRTRSEQSLPYIFFDNPTVKSLGQLGLKIEFDIYLIA